MCWRCNSERESLYAVLVNEGPQALKRHIVEQEPGISWFGQVWQFAAIVALARARNYQ